MKKLPDSEFEIMKVVWTNDPPVTTNTIMESLGKEKDWKAATVISLMLRLVERGFLRTEKHGKERTYYPLIERDAYLKFETGNFLRQFHENSFFSFVNTLYNDKNLTESDLDDLLQWVRERRN
ncbi:MAG: BlaI/MecI/CopY family transcriptional regulator [Planctomycetia bacterium]|nr:BlaI/MecI/CopY family transcriptional regulator [Planctomycetia bacterium]